METQNKQTTEKQTNKKGTSDDPQISRPDLRFANRKTAKQHKTGPEPHKKQQIHGMASRHDRVKPTVSPKYAQTNSSVAQTMKRG